MFIFELWFFFYVILPVLIIGGVVGTFKAAPTEMSDLVKRGALIARANLGSAKSKTVLAKEKLALNPYTGDKDDKQALAAWQSQFDGKELVLLSKDNHRIINSWNELSENMYEDQPIERWYWECNCGEKDWRKTKEASSNAARRHQKLYGGRDDAGVKDVGWLR